MGGQREVEGGALARRTGGPDAAPVLRDDAPADGKPEPGAAHGAGVRRVHLLEALEDVLELVGGYAAALVFHVELGLMLVEQAGGDADFTAGRRKLYGVRDEVGECLQDAVGVRPDLYAVAIDGKPQASLQHCRVLQAGGPFEQVLGRAAGLSASSEVAAADALDVQDVVNQLDEPVGVADGDFEHLARLFGTCLECSASDQAERGAQGLVSGVRSSCETVGDELGPFMRSSARRSVVSVKATTTPMAPPSWPGPKASIWGRATYSTGKLVPSLRQKTSLETRAESWPSPPRMLAMMALSLSGYGLPSARVCRMSSCRLRPSSSSGAVAEHLRGSRVDDW